MALNEKVIKQVRDLCVGRGAQKRNEQVLVRHDFMYVETEGCWVRNGFNLRVYVHGAYWLIYYGKDSADKPTHSGAGSKDLAHEIVSICV